MVKARNKGKICLKKLKSHQRIRRERKSFRDKAVELLREETEMKNEECGPIYRRPHRRHALFPRLGLRGMFPPKYP